MQRALLAIGCDTYDFIDADLEGAELDAQRVFGCLTKPEVGDYDPVRSRLLLSPTLSEVRGALSDIVYGDEPLHTLTLYFAGHGALGAAGFFMLLRDTRNDRLPATAYWLSEALATLASKPPTVTNIILDACFSGGLANDVHVLIKPGIQGDAGSPAIILLAMASRDQFAYESGGGGAGTNALLECLDGRLFIQEHSAALDLMDVGAAVSKRVASNPEQQPRFWALNVNQRSAFCRNPHFQASLEATFTHWSPRAYIETVTPLLASHADSPADQVADVERLISGLILRSQESSDLFLEAEVRATAAAALVRYCPASTLISDFVERECLAASESVGNALRRAVGELRNYKYALLSSRGSVGDLWVLPHRIWKIIGWSGAAFFILKENGREAEFPTEAFGEFLVAIIEHYSLSAILLSERQGSSIAIGLSCAFALGFIEEAEALLGILFNSVLESGGKVARGDIKNDQLLTYMHSRHFSELDKAGQLVANPTEAVSVLLRLAPLFELSDVFDEALIELDHLNLNVFVADDYSQFADEFIEDGLNHTFTVGHGVWTVGDFVTAWPESAARAPDLVSVKSASLLAALLFPDRVPWFVVPLQGPEGRALMGTANPAMAPSLPAGPH